MKHVVRGTKKKSSAPKKIDENYDDSEKIIDQTSIKVKLNRLVRAVDPSNPDHDQSFIDQRTSLLRLIEECVVFGSHSIIQACEVMQRVIITYCTCNSDRYDNEDLGSMIQKSKIYVQSLNAHYVRPRGRGAVEQPLQIITDVREEYFPIDNIPFADLPNNSLRARIFATLASTMETNFLNHYTLNFYVYQGYLIKAFLCRMRGRAKHHSLDSSVTRLTAKMLTLEIIHQQLKNLSMDNVLYLALHQCKRNVTDILLFL